MLKQQFVKGINFYSNFTAIIIVIIIKFINSKSNIIVFVDEFTKFIIIITIAVVIKR